MIEIWLIFPNITLRINAALVTSLTSSANAFTDLLCFAHTDTGRNITVVQRWNMNIKTWDRTRNVLPQWPQTTRMPSGWTGRAGWAGCSSGIIITGLRLMIRLLGAQKNYVSFSPSTFCKFIINAIKYVCILFDKPNPIIQLLIWSKQVEKSVVQNLLHVVCHLINSLYIFRK